MVVCVCVRLARSYGQRTALGGQSSHHRQQEQEEEKEDTAVLCLPLPFLPGRRFCDGDVPRGKSFCACVHECGSGAKTTTTTVTASAGSAR